MHFYSLMMVGLIGVAGLGVQAHASPLYRCTKGEAVEYVQKKPAGFNCSVVKNAPPPPSRPYIPNILPVAPLQPSVSSNEPGRGSVSDPPALPSPVSAPSQLPPLPPGSWN